MNRTTLFAALFCVFSLAGTAALEASYECMPHGKYHVRTLSDTENEEHSSGRLTASASAQFKCTCSDRCRSDCTPSWRGRSCLDRGIVYGAPMGHKEYKKSRLASGTKPWAIGLQGTGADCGAGYGCFAKKCLVGFCGSLSVGVSTQGGGTGVSVSFSPLGAVIHDLQIDMPFQCDACITSTELALKYPRIVDVIQPPQMNMAAWLQICTFTCSGTSCSGNACRETCTERCAIY